MLKMESWKWALIGVGIAVFLAINATVIYCLYYGRHTEAVNALSKEEEGEQEQRSVDSNTIDEGVVASDPKQRPDIQQQQHDYTAAVQTALSPPRPHPNILTKDKALTTPIIHEQAETEPQELRVFSLSPLHVESSTTATRPSEKTNSMCSTSSTTDRSMTPFQHYHQQQQTNTTISSLWRGPTPPWTQHPNNRYRNSTSAEK